MSARTLSPTEMGHLDTAGKWGLLRSLRGHKVCMTGKMSMERTQLARLVEAAGGEFAATVTGATTILITADDFTWTNKARAAEAKGTKVLTETAFAAELLPTVEELLSGRPGPFGSPR